MTRIRGKGVVVGSHLVRLRRQSLFLKGIFANINHSLRKDMLRFANEDQINAISEIAHNILRNGIDLKPEHIQEMKKHAPMIRTIANRNNSLKKKEEVMMSQRGGNLFKSLGKIFMNLVVKPISGIVKPEKAVNVRVVINKNKIFRQGMENGRDMVYENDDKKEKGSC